MFETKINFEKLFNMLEAAQHLQDAGEMEKSKEVLYSLSDIINGKNNISICNKKVSKK